jgi:hypothetical protein
MRRVVLVGAVLVAALSMSASSAWAKKPKTEGLSQEEIATLKHILPHIKYIESGVGGKPTIQFSGVNVQVVNGEGKTATTNGEGNLVIGYDENSRCCRANSGLQTGSHNLVLGELQEFTSYGGIVAGLENSITAPGASATGGGFNHVSGVEASVAGGAQNVASGARASVAGGYNNMASGGESSVGGGNNNTASGWEDSVAGGHSNKATGQWASVSGGESNIASGEESSVSGGWANHASAFLASVSGGEENTASGCASSVSGGSKNTASGCKAVGDDEEFGASSISGGASNTASGEDASVSGGTHNIAADPFGAILGGCGNVTDDANAPPGFCNGGGFAGIEGNAVSGGALNDADGLGASIFGGYQVTEMGPWTWGP